MPDRPFDRSLDALDAYVADPSPEHREALREAWVRDAKRIVSRFAPDPEVYVGGRP